MTISLKSSLFALSLGLAGLGSGPGVAGVAAGAYLAAMHAASESDFAKAAEYFTRALVGDPDNTEMMEEAVAAYVGLGRFDLALPLAERLAATGTDSQIGAIVRLEQLAAAEDYQGVLDLLDNGSAHVAPLVDGLIRAWAELGAGRSTEALAEMDAVAEKAATRAFGLYHKALALALVGDYEGAEAILAGTGSDRLTLTRRGVIARAEILSQLERNADAAKLLTDTFGTDLDPALAELKARLDAGEPLPMTVITDPRDGLAEVFFSVATALNGDTPDGFVLGFTRTAEALQPNHVDAILLSASLLERLHRYDLAIATYDRIPASSPYFHVAELGRADALRRDGQVEESIAVLQRLSETHDSIPAIFVTLGDALRKSERYAEAATAYDRAIALYGPPQESHWVVYFSRGIAEEREKNWDRAEADFRTALKLRPDQPQVLNYLGYSYVEMQRNMDEALDMIQRAVAARPDDGYITDSLGWVYYRLGRYDEAVVQMEKAAELVPVDPVINDHLGDVYWAVGRKREAEFQWSRALSFDPEEADAKRIRRKLEVGLDEVLKEEGAAPLALAKEG
ncbi:tetratricopeptide repeat protein [Frigidibacter sp. ROC022]|uniref:tetratricopeptide repeat protein n=1 Tax=Frigidibacter sp. ROC022 TaxID=2971796 RepID=UPI00215B6653|nr:tetratricopeptide repeat protein [Frigidibacter sp. ROC022]MCR8724917.1 tetratricopeptide repeat protein [Frigidibacter sp. ROC022]